MSFFIWFIDAKVKKSLFTRSCHTYIFVIGQKQHAIYKEAMDVHSMCLLGK